MYFENEISEAELSNANNGKNYTKVVLKATEEERKKMREQMNRQKKKNIQQFLNDVDEKKGTFIHQKKRIFKEDNSRMQMGNGAHS